MITAQCDIYVVGQGFRKAESLTPGNQVYTLDGSGKPEIVPVDSISTDFVSGKINSIDSGAHNVDLTDDARLLYFSEQYGHKYISFNQIPSMTPNKEYIAGKYLPVLSSIETSEARCSLTELEYVARMLAVDEVDYASFKVIVDRCSGSDALVLIDMLEFWCSFAPGQGWFERAQVKSRSHAVTSTLVLDELCRMAALAGFTAAETTMGPALYGFKVSYESMPIPGSRPKNEKYFKKYHSGLMVNINARNRPILGRSKNRVFYLPTTSVLNN